VRHLYQDSKRCISSELPDDFTDSVPAAVPVSTQSQDRRDYILHPPTGEKISEASQLTVQQLAEKHAGAYDVQLILSDGLNALSLTDKGHLRPYLNHVRTELSTAGYRVAPEHIVVTNGRVRAGYRIGEILFGHGDEDDDSPRVILHIIGERPGSGHHAFSVYITSTSVRVWGTANQTDHNMTKVVSGIADTALDPQTAAAETVEILKGIQ
jgi:ethanolamine ammonia-lyase large subunit